MLLFFLSTPAHLPNDAAVTRLVGTGAYFSCVELLRFQESPR